MTWQAKAQQHCDAKKPQSKIPPDKLQALIDDLEDYLLRVTQWEVDFIANIQERVENEQWVTDTQCDKLQELWERHVR